MESVIDEYETWTGPSWRWPTVDAHEASIKTVLDAVNQLGGHSPAATTEGKVRCRADGEHYPCAFLRDLVARYGDRPPAVVQLNDGTYKRSDLLTSEDLESRDAWHWRRYVRALATRKLMRDGKWDKLRCDFLMPGGDHCDRTAQHAGDLSIGEPQALCPEHASCSPSLVS